MLGLTIRAMKALRNIEFLRTQDLSIVYQYKQDEYVPITPSDPIVKQLADKISEEYPEAYDFLDATYSKSRADERKHRFDIVMAFLSCNCGGVDDRMDIDDTGRFNFEPSNCPSLFCKGRGIVCGAKFRHHMTKRQEETMRLYVGYIRLGCSYDEARSMVAERMGISPATVDTNKRDAFDRECVNSMAEFILKMEGRL